MELKVKSSNRKWAAAFFLLTISVAALATAVYYSRFSRVDFVSAKFSPPMQQFQGDGKTFALLMDLPYEIKRTGKIIKIPAGFVHDFASVPRILQSIVPALGTYSVPAIVHDYLYWEQTCSREQADAILFDAMGEYESANWEKQLVYYGVRVGGGSAWKANTADRQKGFPKVIPIEHRPAISPAIDEINNLDPTGLAAILAGNIQANAKWADFRQKLFEKGVKAPLAPPVGADYCKLAP